MSQPAPCVPDIFRNGTPILASDTGSVGGNVRFERWVQAVAAASGQPVDWHYSGGRAQVLALGDLDRVRQAARDIPLPEGQSILWFFDAGEGLYRAGVS